MVSFIGNIIDRILSFKTIIINLKYLKDNGLILKRGHINSKMFLKNKSVFYTPIRSSVEVYVM